MQQRKPVLAISDLSSRSDAAVETAGFMAQLLDSELHVLHPLGLTNRPMRTVMPALNNLRSVTQLAEAAMRAQLRRVVPQLSETALSVVGLDDAWTALVKRAGTVRHNAVVTAPVWRWSANGTGRNELPLTGLKQLGLPLFQIPVERSRVHNRVLLICADEFVDEDVIEATRAYSFILLRGYRAVSDVREPQLDVLLLDGKLSAAAILAYIATNPADLVALHIDSLVAEQTVPYTQELMPALLAQRSNVPVVLVPTRGSWGGGGKRDQFAHVTAA